MNKYFIVDFPDAHTDNSLPAGKILGCLATTDDGTGLQLAFKNIKEDGTEEEITAQSAGVDDGVVTILFGTGE